MGQARDPGGEATTPHDAGIDRTVVAGQIGREPRAMAGVAVRCAFGFPAVTHQAPFDAEGRPFPTAYYLTCPHLVRQVDRVEAAGGVRRHEEAMAADPALQSATDAAHSRHRLVDERGVNIGGSTDTTRLKCLHAHAAFAMAEGDHPVGEAALREASPRWCDDARCASLALPPRE